MHLRYSREEKEPTDPSNPSLACPARERLPFFDQSHKKQSNNNDNNKKFRKEEEEEEENENLTCALPRAAQIDDSETRTDRLDR